MSSEAIGNAPGAVPYESMPAGCRDDLDKDKDMLVVSWLLVGRFLCGMQVIKVANEWTQRSGCDDLGVVVLVVVNSQPVERSSSRRVSGLVSRRE